MTWDLAHRGQYLARWKCPQPSRQGMGHGQEVVGSISPDEISDVLKTIGRVWRCV